MDNITELKELIYTGMKLSWDKLCVPQRNPNRNIKLGWEIIPEGQAKKLWQLMKMLKRKKHRQIWRWEDQSKTADISDNATWKDKSKDIGKKKQIKKILRQDQAIQSKQDFPKWWKKILLTSWCRMPKDILKNGDKESKSILEKNMRTERTSQKG